MTDETKNIETMSPDELLAEATSNSNEVDQLITEGDRIVRDLNQTLTEYDAALGEFQKELDTLPEE